MDWAILYYIFSMSFAARVCVCVCVCDRLTALSPYNDSRTYIKISTVECLASVQAYRRDRRVDVVVLAGEAGVGGDGGVSADVETLVIRPQPQQVTVGYSWAWFAHCVDH